MAYELTEYLEPSEVVALLKIPSRRYPTGRRNKAMILLMLNCGLRASEVVGHEDRKGEGGLRIKDVDLLSGKIILRDTKDTRKRRAKKAKAGRVLFANGETLKALQDWWEVRVTLGPNEPDDFFFVTLKGTRMQTSYLRLMMIRYCERAGIDRSKAHPHILRHTFGTEFYRHTKDLRLTQEILGHSSPELTQRYAHVSGADVEQALKDFQMV